MKFSIVTASLFLFVVAGCSPSSNDHAVPKGWVNFAVSNIFSIKHPKGWDVQFNRVDGRIRVTNGANENVYIWPVFSPKPLDEYRGSVLLKRIVSKLVPGMQWNSPVRAERRYVSLSSSNRERISAASLAWVTGNDNSAAICYVVTAPREHFVKDKDILASILSSFHPVIERRSGSSGPKFTDLQYYRWEDPDEHAFSVEVPRGWSIQGGLKRYSPTDCRPGVNLISPQRKVNVFFKDPSIPTFVLPNPTLTMAGNPEGTYDRLQDGTMALVRRYVAGSSFAYEYAGRRFSNGFSDFQIVKTRNRPDIAYVDGREYAALNASGMGVVHSSVTAGDVYFTGRRNGQLYSGYVEAATSIFLTPYGGAGVWQVHQLYGFCAPSSRVVEAAAVMERLVSSFRWNPQWYMMQNKITANVTQIVSQAADQMADIIDKSFEIGQKNTDEALRNFDDYIRGTITLRDKNGEQFNVWNTSNYYWADKFNDVGGTKLFLNPDISRFRRLMKVK